MSDNYIYVVPKDPYLALDEARRENAASFFRSIAPEADEIATSVSEHITFVDCAENFERVCCPSCAAEIETGTWQEWMDNDFDGEGFSFAQHAMPCCGARHFLHELRYEWPQAFARSKVRAMNPNIGKLTEEQCRQFERILGCPVRVIYQHI
jgi:hypothetical protein